MIIGKATLNHEESILPLGGKETKKKKKKHRSNSTCWKTPGTDRYPTRRERHISDIRYVTVYTVRIYSTKAILYVYDYAWYMCKNEQFL